MIQINLIPDVKQQYLNARKTRNIAVSVSIFAGFASVGLVVVLGLAIGAQRVFEMTVDNGIKDEYAKLTAVDSLDEAVVLQKQLSTIPSLNNDKIVSSRLFNFLEAVNPGGDNAVQFTNVTLNPDDTTLFIEGVAANYTAVDVFKKTINSTKLTYVSDGSSQEESIASGIENGDSSLGEDGDGQQVLRFSMTVTYNNNLFSNAISDAVIVSPKGPIDMTDSRTGVPDGLFSAAATDTGEGN
jgi:hypothetical protein